MAISTTLKQVLSVLNTLTGAYISSGDNTFTVNGLNNERTLSGTTTPAVTKAAAFEQALTGGAATIDLTALPGQTDDETVDGTGLKVVCCMFRAKSTNVDPITITFGAANPYPLLGAAFTFDLEPGQVAGPFYLIGLAPAISGTVKNIDISGTGTEALECEFVMG